MTAEKKSIQPVQADKKPQNKEKKQDSRTARMGTAPISTLLLEFAIPSIAGMLINSCYNVISSIFLGQAMGATGLAVTTAAFPIMVVFMALAMLIGNGGNALAALRLGQGNKAGAEKTLGNTVSLGIVISLIIVVFVTIPPCMELLLSVSSTIGEIHDLTRNYIWILGVGVIFQIIGMGVNNFIRTAGAPNRALLTMVIGAVASIILNYLFVMVFGWGVEGSALATILGWLASFASVLWYFILTPNTPIKLQKKYLKLERILVLEILKLGLASFLLQTAICVANLIINYQLVKFGNISDFGAENALAAIGVVGKIAGIAIMPILGISAAAQPLLGYNYGAGNLKRVRHALGFALLYGVIIGLVVWGITRLWPYQIVGAFGVENDLMALALFALEVQMLLIPLVGIQIISSNYFQATGQPVKATFLSLIRQVIIFMPALLIIPEVLPLVMDIDPLYALFASWPVSDFLSIFIAGMFLIHELTRLKKIEQGKLSDKYVGGQYKKKEAN